MADARRFDADEKRELDENGFVLRRGVFDDGEIGAIRDDCEALVTRLLEEKRHTKLVVGSYRFELQRRLRTIVKWEKDDPDLLQGVEPFAHISEALRSWALDPRLVDPSKDVVGAEQIDLFTEKLNLKRAHKGGPIVLHQDHPYWSDVSQVASRVATAMIFLDDATIENGCLEVVPGSHREGLQQRLAVEGFGAFEMDPAKFNLSRLTPLEVPAGSAVFFGPFLVHRSLPNRSGEDRRALLFSYQPAGYPHLRDLVNYGPPREP